MLQRSSEPLYPVQEEASPIVAEGRLQPTFDLREMARILRRRLRLVALPPLALVGLAFAYLTVVSTLYTATSTVLVDPRRANVVETNQIGAVEFRHRRCHDRKPDAADPVGGDPGSRGAQAEADGRPGISAAPRPARPDQAVCSAAAAGRRSEPRGRRAFEVGGNPAEADEGHPAGHDLPRRHQCQLGIAAEGRDHRQRHRGRLFRGAGPLQIRRDADRRHLARRPDQRSEIEASSRPKRRSRISAPPTI